MQHRKNLKPFIACSTIISLPAAVFSAVNDVAQSDIFEEEGINAATCSHQLFLNTDLAASQVGVLVAGVV